MVNMRKFNAYRQRAGLEWVILKRLPKHLLAGTMVPILMALMARWIPIQGSPSDIVKYQTSVEILAIALGVTAWTAVFTVAIGCVIVVVMKGPVYVADSYKLTDFEKPDSNTDRE